MAIRVFFKAAAAVSLTGAGVIGGYAGGNALYHRVADTPMPATTPGMIARAGEFETRFAKLAESQKQLEQTTDEEQAAQMLLNEKTGFVTDALLDRDYSERDLRAMAARFNKLSGEDGIRFRSHNFSARSVARRNECLRTTPANSDQFGADRYAYAQRVETCMIETTQNAGQQQLMAAHMGGAVGGFAVGGFFLGYGAGRRRMKPAE